MNHAKEIKTVKARIEELQDIKNALQSIEDRVCAIEQEVGKIDCELPYDGMTESIPDKKEREQVLQLYDVIDEAYRLIDEILGPADELGERDDTGLLAGDSIPEDDPKAAALEKAILQFQFSVPNKKTLS